MLTKNKNKKNQVLFCFRKFLSKSSTEGVSKAVLVFFVPIVSFFGCLIAKADRNIIQQIHKTYSRNEDQQKYLLKTFHDPKFIKTVKYGSIPAAIVVMAVSIFLFTANFFVTHPTLSATTSNSQFTAASQPAFNLSSGGLVKTKGMQTGFGKVIDGNSSITAKVVNDIDQRVKVVPEITSNGAAPDAFNVTVPRPNQFRPGAYKLDVTIRTPKIVQTLTQDFKWGVLAINPDKSVYTTGKTAFIAMGVLDDNGHMVCNAKVTLQVVDPSGHITTLSTTNGSINVSDTCHSYTNGNAKPDYYASYQTKLLGHYILRLHADTSNGPRDIQDGFIVKNQPMFDVLRNTETRISLSDDVKVDDQVTAKTNFNGSVQETVPASFTVQPGDFVDQTVGDQQILTWNTSLATNQTEDFIYYYKAPDISPQFYTIGPLTFLTQDNNNLDSKILFQEPRQWEIAADANACTLTLSASVSWTTTWANCGSETYPGQNVVGDTAEITPSATTSYTLTISASIPDSLASIALDGAAAAGTITVSGAYTVNVTTSPGTITINQGTAAVTNSFNINTGTVNTYGNVIFPGTTTTASYIAQVAVTSGTLYIGQTAGAADPEISYATNTTAANAVVSVTTGTVEIAGAQTLYYGTLKDTAVGTINLLGGILVGNNTAPVFTQYAGSVVDIGGPLTVYTSTSYVFTVNSTEVFTANSTITPTASTTLAQVTINSGVTITLAGSILQQGLWTNNSAGSGTAGLNPGIYTVTTTNGVIFAGTAITSFYNLTVSDYSAVTANTSFTVTNSLTFNAASNGAQSLTLGSSSVVATVASVAQNQPTGATPYTSAFNVNAGTLTVSGTYNLGGATATANDIDTLVLTTGTINLNGSTSFNGASNTPANHIINLSGGAGTLNVAGSMTNTAYVTMTPGTTSTVNFNGTAAQTIPMGTVASGTYWGACSTRCYGLLTINNTNSATGATLGNAVVSGNVAGNVTVGTGSNTVYFSNGGYAMAGASGTTFTVNNGATFNMTASSVYPTGFTTFTYGASSTVDYYQSTASTVVAATYGNLVLEPSASTITFTLGSATSQTITVAGSLTTGVNGSYTVATITGATYYPTLTVTGGITIGANSTLTAGAAEAINDAGGWTNSGNGFTPSTSTVTLNGAGASTQILSGNTTFRNLTATSSSARTIEFTAGTATTVSGTWTVTGAASNLITLTSTTASTWNISPTVASISYADIDYSSTSLSTCATYSQSTNSGNNANWDISSNGSCGASISGTSNASSGTVDVAVGSTPQTPTSTISGGTWTIYGITLANGNIVTAWISGATGTSRATDVGLYNGNGSTNMSGLVLNLNVSSIGSADNQSLSIANLGNYTNTNNSSILNSVTTGGSNTLNTNSGDLDVLSGNTLTAGTSDTITTNNVINAGTITCTGNTAITVGAGWTNSGTFTDGTSTVTFNSGTTGNTINTGGTAAADTFYNLTFNNASGGWSFSTNAVNVTNNFTETNSETTSSGLNLNNLGVTVGGNLTASGGKMTPGSSTINVGGSWDTSGLTAGYFVYGTSTVNLTGSGNVNLGAFNSSRWFYNLQLAASGQTTKVLNDMPVKNVATLGTGILTGPSYRLWMSANSGTPLVNAGATINLYQVVFTPTVASSTVPVPGGNYGTTTQLELYAQASNVTFNITGAITGASYLYIESNTGTTGDVVNSNSNSITANGLRLGYSTVTGSDTLDFGSSASTVNIGSSGVQVWTDAGAQSINLGAATITDAGSWTDVNGTGTLALTPGTSTVTMTGNSSGNTTITSNNQSFNNLTINNTQGTYNTVTQVDALNLNGNLLLTSGTFASASLAINLAGNWTNNGGTFTPGTQTVTFNGTTAQAIGGSASTTFSSLTDSNTTAALSVNTNIYVPATLTMNGANTILTPAAGITINTSAGSSTLTGTGTVQVSRITATPDFVSQYVFNTYTLTNLTVQYTGTAAQTIDALSYSNLTITPGASSTTWTIGSGTLGVTGTLNLNSNGTSSTTITDATNNSPLNISGNFTIPANTTFTAPSDRENYIPNPSLEANNVYWGMGASGTLTGLTYNLQDTTHVLYGTYAAEFQTAGATGQYYMYHKYVYPVIGQTYTLSASVYIPAGSPITAIKLGIRDGSTWTYLAGNTAASLTAGQWNRISTTYTATTANPSWVISVADPVGGSSGNIGTYWVDGTMLEQSASMGSYFDGANNGGYWLGTTDQSYSLMNKFTVGGSWTNAGTFTANGGTVTFNSSTTGKTINSGGTAAADTFYNMVFNNASGGWSLSTNAINVSNDFTELASETTSNGLNLNNLGVTIGGNFSAIGGKMTPGSSTINVGGSFDSSGINLGGSTSTINLTGSGSVNTGGTNYLKNFNAAAAGQTTTLISNTMIYGVGTLGTGTLTGSSYTFQISDNGSGTLTPLVNAGATINLSKFTIEPITTGCTFTIPGGNYGTVGYLSFTFYRAATINITGPITVNGIIWIASSTGVSGGTVYTQSNSITANGLRLGDFTATGSDTLDFGSSASTVNIGTSGVYASGTSGTHTLSLGGANITNAGPWTDINNSDLVNLTPGTSTVTMTGNSSGNTTITSNSQSFNNLTINNTQGTYKTVTEQDSLSLNGNYLQTTGIFNDNSQSMYVGGNWTNNGGTFTPGASTVYLDSGTTATVTGNTGFNNLDLDTTVSHLAKTVNFASGSTQTITGSLLLNGESGHVLTLGRNGGSGTNQWTLAIPSDYTTGPDITVANSNVTGGTIYPNNYVNVINGGNNTGWAFDVSAPTVPGTPSTTTPSATNKPTWTWTASTDNQSGLAAVPYTVQWSQDNTFTTGVSTDTASTNIYTHSTALADGTWYFRVNATDLVGNTSSYSSNGSVLIDTTAPSIPGTPSTTTPTKNNKPAWTWTASTDNGSGIANYTVNWCQNALFTGCSSNIDTTLVTSYTMNSGLADGTWYFRTKANDNVGNSSNYSSNGSALIDTVAPTTTDTGTDTDWHSTTVTVTLHCNDSGSGCASTYYTTDGSTPTPSSSQGTSVILSTDGIYTIKYFSTDNAGNQETVEVAQNQVKVDKTGPTTPGAPSFSSLTASSLTLSWSSSTDSGSGLGNPTYHVERAPDNLGSAGTFAEIGTSNTNTYNDSALSANTKYWYRVRAIDAVSNYSSYSASANDITMTNVPTSPSATANSSSQITVSWSAPTTGGVDHYDVYSSSNGYAFTIYSSTGTTTFQLSLLPNTQYTYHIYGANANNVESATYASVSKYTLTNTPIAPSANAISANQIDITWTVPTGGVTSYHLYSSSNNYSSVIYSGSGTSTSQSSLSANTQYTYRVYGVNANGIESNTYGSASAYTLSNTPVLDNPVSPTNNVTPPISNSNTPDLSFANQTVDLYVDGTWQVTTLANSSGVFTFTNANYTADTYQFPYGQHSIYVTAQNGDGIDSADSATKNINIDNVDPTAPITTSAWTDNTKATVLASDTWNGHNAVNSVYFEWSGATDPIPLNQLYASGLAHYYIYFGSNSSATPSIDGTQTADTTAHASMNLISPVSGTNYYFIIQSEDAAGNLSSPVTLFIYKYDSTPPPPLSYVMPNPSGWSDSDPYSFSWPVSTDPISGTAGYEYERENGTDNWTFTTNLSASGINHYQSGANYFDVRVEDNAGNFSSIVTADYYYSGSVTAPQNLQVDLSQSQGQTVNMFNFSWSAPLTTTAVGYYYSVNATPNMNDSTYTTATSTGFLPLATQEGMNTFYVVAKDQYGNVGWDHYALLSFTINTSAPGIPSNLLLTDSSNRDTDQYTLTLRWLAPSFPSPDFSGYVVRRSTDGVNYTTRATLDKTNTGYLDTGLSNAADYYYEVEAIDNVGKTSLPSASVNMIPTGKYTIPPAITTEPRVSVKSTSAVVTWDTSRSANSIVQYGTSTNYGQENSQSATYGFSHSITLTGLIPGTIYHYRVASIDLYYDYSEESAFSRDYTFTALPAPTISGVATSGIGLTSAIVSWKTTSASTSEILYGLSTYYGQTYQDNSGSQTTTHTVNLTNLTSSTTYHFKIRGTDIDGNSLSSDDYIFTTLTFPVLSGLSVTHVSDSRPSTIAVSFNSNVPTSVLVTFDGRGGESVSQFVLGTTHQLSITGLLDNTTYTVTAIGRDAYGNESAPIGTTFTTPFDTTPPLITDITVETSVLGYGTDAKGQVVVSWTTDKASTSQVEYGSGVAGDTYTSKTEEDTALTETHVVVISGLKTSAPYHFRVISKDHDGNTGISGDNSVLTEQATDSILELVIHSLQSSLGWIFKSL